MTNIKFLPFHATPLPVALSATSSKQPANRRNSLITKRARQHIPLFAMTRSVARVSIAVAAAASSALAFAPSSSAPPQQQTAERERRTVGLRMAPPGGWGIPGAGGTSFRDEEFADNRGRASRQGRRGYDAYELENRGAFMKRVKEEHKGLKNKKKDELLSIAKMAGIKTKKKEGLYGKFDAEDFEDFALDDEDDLDLRVTDEVEVVVPEAPVADKVEVSETPARPVRKRVRRKKD